MTDVNLNIGSEVGRDDKRPVLLLSIHNQNDSRLIREFLPDFLTVNVSENGISGKSFDLCILDEPSLLQNTESLQQMKTQAAPIFLPFLLLSQNKATVRSNPTALEFADDVVDIPVSTQLLQARINLLLKQREYSLKLKQKSRQLEQKNRELAEEKRKYQLITENSTDMISLHAPDGTYLYVSPAVKELTGYEPEDLLGCKPFDNMHPQDHKIFGNEDLFADQEVKRFTFRKETINGGYKWVESFMRPIVDEETGEIIEIQASTRDISERKRFEQKLKEEKDFIDKAIRSLPEVFYMIDENQNFIKWNNIERVLGYSDKEMRNMHPMNLFREEDQEFITNKIQKVFETGFVETEVKIKSKSGELIPHLVTAQKFTRGDTDFIVGTGINLSEIKETQYELEQHRQLLDAIINQTKSLIYLKDIDRKYRLVNDSYLEFYGLKRDEIIGKTDREVHGSLADKVSETDYKVLENREISEFEEVRSNKNESRYCHTIKYPLKGVPGFENCMCGISTDITDLKQATNQLQERVKEQRCLYKISSLPEQNLTIDELLEEAVTYLPDGWYHPEATVAAITFGGKTYRTEDFHETTYMLSAESKRITDKPLAIQIAYTDEDVNSDPFQEEERKLVTTVADSLSSQIDRILAQEKLKESQQRWESLVNNDPDLIQISDSDGMINFINPSGAKMYGVDDPEKLVGMNFFDLLDISDDDLEIIKARMQKALEGGSLSPRTYKMATWDGTERYVEIQSVSITLENGEKGLQQVAQDITDRKRYEEELKQSIEEKEVLLQEIHHRVKNNLAVVSGMLQLQAFNTENEDVRSLLNDSERRIKTMALIHEKLYQSQSLSHIDFGLYVKELIKNIKKVSSQNEEITISFEYDSFNLNVNQAVPCALILNELIANAYEHAFTDQREGNIDLTIREKEDVIHVQISDDGKGLPLGIESLEKKSMGYTIINTLIKQLNADYNVNTGEGTQVSFSFERQEIKGSSSTLIK